MVFRFSSNFGSDASETFGHFTTCDGGEFGLNGYGWCDHASNFSLGFAFATSSANLAGRVRGAEAVCLVAAAGGRLADRDLGLRVPGLEPRIPGGSQLRVVRRRH